MRRAALPLDGASKRGRFVETAIGYVHIDVCELRLAEGKLFTFLAIDRVTKFTHVAFLDANTKANGAAFLRDVVQAFPCKIHTVLTDNGMAFAELPTNRGRHATMEAIFGSHIFDRVCDEHGIEHRLTKPPLDQWSGRADEPRHQGRHHKGLSRPGPRRPQGARLGLRHRLELRQTP